MMNRSTVGGRGEDVIPRPSAFVVVWRNVIRKNRSPFGWVGFFRGHIFRLIDQRNKDPSRPHTFRLLGHPVGKKGHRGHNDCPIVCVCVCVCVCESSHRRVGRVTTSPFVFGSDVCLPGEPLSREPADIVGQRLSLSLFEWRGRETLPPALQDATKSAD